MDEPEYDEEHGVAAGAECVEDEEQKVFVISDSDAVVDPGAVVVHFDYAPFADTAVMRPIRFKGVTTTTQPFRFRPRCTGRLDAALIDV